MSAIMGENAHKRVHGFSRASATRLRNALEALIYTAKWKSLYIKSTKSYFRYKINFITLTLPSKQIHSDQEIQREVFSKFMEAWAKRRPGLLYVWKAECQDNGNVHFHVTSNAFYHYEKLRRDWNKAINKLGYVDRSGLDSPNSTDVHAVSKVKNLAGYMIKYLSKSDNYTRVLIRYHRRFKVQLRENPDSSFQLPTNYFKFIKRKVTSRLWGASKPLLASKFNFSMEDADISKDIATLQSPEFEHNFLKLEHCWLLPNSADWMPFFPQIQGKYMEQFSLLTKKQSESANFKEEIDKL